MNLSEIFSQNIDFIAFSVGAMLVFAILRVFFWRGSTRKWITYPAFAFLACILIGGWWLVKLAGLREHGRLRRMLEGFVPTYAQEFELLGHHQVNAGTLPDDPLYVKLVATQKRWLQVNPMVNDIYTFGHRPDGKLCLLVDAETDYDRNGKYEGEREQRTEIGEVYEEDLENIESAFRLQPGSSVFTDNPVEDRWGIWVSAYTPLRNPDGTITAVLGVDFDAKNWQAAAARARLTAISWLGVLALAVAALATAASVMQLSQDHRQEKEAQRLKSAGQAKFETLVHSIDGIVWEWSPSADKFTFLSRQAEEFLGFKVEECLKSGFWEDHVVAEDREEALRARKAAARDGRPYCSEYRFSTADGRTHWLRENGNPARNEAGEVELLRGVLTDVTDAKTAAEEREVMQKQIVEASRYAGMAEVATGVLHNVGNVLNSVNVSSEIIQGRLRQSKSQSLSKLAELLRDQEAQLGEFFTTDSRGRLVPGYVAQLSKQLSTEHLELSQEVENLVRNVEHIKDIVVMQQAYAKLSGRTEAVDPRDLLEDALRLNAAAFARHRITVERQFVAAPKITVDRHRVLQILVNLIRNAKHALDAGRDQDKIMTLGLCVLPEGWVRVIVADNGVGISPENLKRIFSHGFTTKDRGHGFGLHISAVTAQEMGGCLWAHSDGPGKGAIFCLDLPGLPAEAGRERESPPPMTFTTSSFSPSVSTAAPTPSPATDSVPAYV